MVIFSFLILIPTHQKICAAPGDGTDLIKSQFQIAASMGLSNKDVKSIVIYFLKWLLGIVGVLAVIGFVISGIMYITAAGDDDKISQAKSMMTYSIIGISVALLGLVIVQAISFIIDAGSTVAPPADE